MECTLQLVSGRALDHGVRTSIVGIVAVSSIQLLARFRAKIILAIIGLSTRSSAAPRMISQQHSGGLEVICEVRDLNHSSNIPLDCPKSVIVVAALIPSSEGKTRRYNATQLGQKKQRCIKTF